MLYATFKTQELSDLSCIKAAGEQDGAEHRDQQASGPDEPFAAAFHHGAKQQDEYDQRGGRRQQEPALGQKLR